MTLMDRSCRSRAVRCPQPLGFYQRLMAKKPDVRPATGEDLADELATLVRRLGSTVDLGATRGTISAAVRQDSQGSGVDATSSECLAVSGALASSEDGGGSTGRARDCGSLTCARCAGAGGGAERARAP